MERVTAQSRIILHYLQFLGLQFLVSSRCVTRRGLALFPRLGAFDRDDFPRHKIILSPLASLRPLLLRPQIRRPPQHRQCQAPQDGVDEVPLLVRVGPGPGL